MTKLQDIIRIALEIALSIVIWTRVDWSVGLLALLVTLHSELSDYALDKLINNFTNTKIYPAKDLEIKSETTSSGMKTLKDIQDAAIKQGHCHCDFGTKCLCEAFINSGKCRCYEQFKRNNSTI